MEPAARPHITTAVAYLPQRSPLGIQLSAPDDCQHQLTHYGFSQRQLLDVLLQELQQQGAWLSRRPVPWISWQLPDTLLDSAGITELMYFIGRRFALGESSNPCYQVSVSSSQLQQDVRSRLALFKGLGFNRLCLRLNHPAELQPQTLTLATKLCDEFQLQGYSLQLASFVPDLSRLLQPRMRSGPDSISCDRALVADHRFPAQFGQLRTLGYRVLGNDWFVAPHSTLARAQQQHQLRVTLAGFNSQNVSDLLGLGPGSRSSVQGSYQHNPADLESYFGRDHHRRPEATSPSALKPVIDELLCYHRLDLDYLSHRYQLPQLESRLRAAWPLSHSRPLYRLHQGQLTLTDIGILQIGDLCQRLLQQARPAN